MFRVGPIAVGGRETFWYPTSPATAEVFHGNDDAEVLARIKAALPDRTLACEPALAAAGQPLGYEVRPPTALEANARAKLWLNVEAGDWYRGITDHIAQAVLLEGATQLMRRGPGFEGVAELEVAIRGRATGHDFDETVAVLWTGTRGLFVFESSAAMRVFQDHTAGGDLPAADAVPRWVLELVLGSQGLQDAMREAYGIPAIPIVCHDGAAGRRAVDVREAWRVALGVWAVRAWAEARTERASSRLELADVAVALECGFQRALVDGGDGGLRELDWPELAARLA